MPKDIFKKELKINWKAALRPLRFLFFLAIFLGIIFLGWKIWLFWQAYEGGRILPPLSSKINKAKIEEELKLLEGRENFGPLLKEKEGGRDNPFAPF